MRLVGLLAAVLAAFCFARLAEAHFGERARLGILWYAIATVCDLAIGRLTYAVAAAIGLAALFAASRARLLIAGLLAALCGAAAPLAGLFLGLAAAALLISGWRDSASRRRALCLGIPGVGTGLLLTIAFTEGGREPFGWRPWLVAVFLTLGFLVVLPRVDRTLRVAAVLYLLGTVLAFVLVTPIGDNTTRLGADFAGPLLACALLARGPSPSSFRALTPALLVGLLAWQWFAPVREFVKGIDDPVSQTSSYTGLLSYLARHDAADGRVEVTFTRSHWEAAILAPLYPLARGWEKQLDTADNPLFYGRPLPSAVYHAWLDELAVRYVVLSTAPLDPASKRESKLVLSGVPYLRAVYSDPNWRVFEVLHPTGLASPPGAVTRFGAQSFAVDFSRPGTSLVRVRFSPYWRARSGCVSRGPGGFTQVSSPRAGNVPVTISFAVARILDHGVRCG